MNFKYSAKIVGFGVAFLAVPLAGAFGAEPDGTDNAASGYSSVAETNLPAPAQQAIHLARAGISEEVIVAQLKSLNMPCKLSAEQIIALTNYGVSQNVIKALIEPAPPSPSGSGGSPGDALPESTAGVSPAQTSSDAVVLAQPVTTSVTLEYFQAQLAPYGTWTQIPGYGWGWVPMAGATDPNWRPYADHGYWVYTEDGWYWQSDYPWGWAAFHYGRWTRMSPFGWVWIPDYTWGSAWVCWREAEAEGYCGWAPLPPSARFVPGVGLVYRGLRAGDIDFGLSLDAFVFVAFDHLLDMDWYAHRIGRERFSSFFGRTHVRNSFRIAGDRFIVDGLGRDRVAAFTHRDLKPVVVVPRQPNRPAPVIKKEVPSRRADDRRKSGSQQAP